MGDKKSKWDNGLYTNGHICGENIEFLVDSGSTTTLISKDTFDRMGGENKITLYNRSCQIQGVDGKDIKVYGYVNASISFDNDTTLEHPIMVCEISP